MRSFAFFIVLITCSFLVACPAPNTTDAGPSNFDAGQTANDAGQTSYDAGQMTEDAGQTRNDAGSVEDAGQVCPSSSCDGLDVYVECDAEGNQTRTFCAEGDACIDDGETASCRSVECTPGSEPICSPQGALSTCTPLGQFLDAQCEPGFFCQTGECAPFACVITAYSDSFGSSDFALIDDEIVFDVQTEVPDATVEWLLIDGEVSVLDEQDQNPNTLVVQNYGYREVVISAIVGDPINQNSCTKAINVFYERPALSVELGWDVPTSDLDLHLARETDGGFCLNNFGGTLATFCSDEMQGEDCYYGNCKNTSSEPIDWDGEQSTDGDPQLVIDDLSGYGPEVIQIESPIDGRYLAAAYVFSLRDGGTTNATASIYVHGTYLGGTSASDLRYRDPWEAGIISWQDDEACFESLADGQSVCISVSEAAQEALPPPVPNLCQSDDVEPNNKVRQPATLPLGVASLSTCYVDVDRYSVDSSSDEPIYIRLESDEADKYSVSGWGLSPNPNGVGPGLHFVQDALFGDHRFNIRADLSRDQVSDYTLTITSDAPVLDGGVFLDAGPSSAPLDGGQDGGG